MSNNRLLDMNAPQKNVMVEIRARELGLGVSRRPSRRDRVGIGVCSRPGGRAGEDDDTCSGAAAAEHPVYHGR